MNSNMNIKQETSIFISFVHPRTKDSHIQGILKKQGLGMVSRIDRVHKKDSKGNEYDIAFVYFDHWFKSKSAESYQRAIYEESNKQHPNVVQISYDVTTKAGVRKYYFNTFLNRNSREAGEVVEDDKTIKAIWNCMSEEDKDRARNAHRKANLPPPPSNDESNFPSLPSLKLPETPPGPPPSVHEDA